MYLCAVEVGTCTACDEDPDVLGTASRQYNTMHPCLINKIGRGRRKRGERERKKEGGRGEGEGGRERERQRERKSETYHQSRGCMDPGSCPEAVHIHTYTRKKDTINREQLCSVTNTTAGHLADSWSILLPI